MTFHVYENWTIRKAAIHRSDCGHCNYGNGKHAGSSTRNGRWLGPFATYAGALLAAQETGQPASDCGHCGGRQFGSARSRTVRSSRDGHRGRERSRHQATNTLERVERLILDLEHYLQVFDERRPFSEEGWRLHREAIEAARRASGVTELVADDGFLRLVYRTLEEWGMNSRGARLLDESEFAKRIRTAAPTLNRLEGIRIDAMDSVRLARVTSEIWKLMSEIRGSATRSFLVGASKTLHHLLPDLVPPMDGRYTYKFFRYTTLEPAKQEAAFKYMYPRFHEIAVACHDTIARHVGNGPHTSVTKTIDNAIIGYGLTHEGTTA